MIVKDIMKEKDIVNDVKDVRMLGMMSCCIVVLCCVLVLQSGCCIVVYL